ncbi:MAG: hypothetical protein ACJ749_07075 [Flavisolibacter sp.]
MRHFFFIGVTLLTSTLCFSQKQLVIGQKITGDFNGDRKTDTAFLKVKTNSKSKVHSWTLSFSDKSIPAMPLGCCDVILINEGDLNGDKTTEISVFQAPENGCVYMWTTYSLKTNRWTKFIEPFLIATDCENFKPADLQNRVFKENGKVYYWDVDPNDEENKPIKKQVLVR